MAEFTGLLQNFLKGGEKPRALLGGLLGGDTSALHGALDEVKQLFNPEYMKNVKGIGKNEALNLALNANPIMAATFIGKSAKTWDALSHAKALDMAKNGVDERAIWSGTGNFKGADGHWRQEIPDNSAIIKDFGKNKEGAKLHEALDHEQLYSAYPAQQYTNINLKSESNLPPHLRQSLIGKGDASYQHVSNNGEPLITSEAYSPQDTSSTLHELQHSVQEKEGFAKGGSLDSAFMEMKADEFNKLKDSLLPDVQKLGLDENSTAMTVWQRARLQAYRNLAGEAEARATQSRMTLTPQERLAKFPFDSYDVPRDSLIVRGLLGGN